MSYALEDHAAAEMLKRLKSLVLVADFNGHDLLLAKFFNNKAKELSEAKQKALLTSCLTALSLNAGRAAEEVLAECWSAFAEQEARRQKLESVIGHTLKAAAAHEYEDFKSYGEIIVEQMVKLMSITDEALFKEETVHRLVELATIVLQLLSVASGRAEEKVEACRRLTDKVFAEMNEGLLAPSAHDVHARDAISNPSLVEAIRNKGEVLKVWMTDADINAVLKSKIDQSNSNLSNTDDFNEFIVGEGIPIIGLADRLNDYIKSLNEKMNRLKERSIINPTLSFKRVTLYIPINLQGSHWVTGCFSFEIGSLSGEGVGQVVLKKARLIDSLEKDASQKTSLLSLLSSEVRRVNKVCEIEVEATGEQRDGTRCGDYTCREILTAVGDNRFKDKQGEGLREGMISHLKALLAIVAAPVSVTVAVGAKRSRAQVDLFQESDLPEEELTWQVSQDFVLGITAPPEAKRSRLDDEVASENHEKLISLIRTNNAEAVQEFINNNPVNLDKKIGKSGFNALMIAVNTGNVDVVKALLAAGARTDSWDSKGNTALMIAVNRGNVDVVKALLEAGAPINQKRKRGLSALMRAVDCHKINVVEILLAAGAKANLSDSKGNTALIRAVNQINVKSKVNLIRALLAGGAKVDLPDYKGNTPLMHALFNGSLDEAEALLKAGADLDIKNKAGKTPRAVIIEKNYGSFFKYFTAPKPLGVRQSSKEAGVAAVASAEHKFSGVFLGAETSPELSSEMLGRIKSLILGGDFNGHDLLLAKFFNDKARSLSEAKQKALLTSCLTALSLSSGSPEEVLAECWIAFSDQEERVQKLEAAIYAALEKAEDAELENFKVYGVFIVEQMIKLMSAISIEELLKEEIVNRLVKVAQTVLLALSAENSGAEAKIEACRRITDQIFLSTNEDLAEASANAKHADDASRNPSLIEALGSRANPFTVWMTDSDIKAVLKSRIDQAHSNLSNDDDFDAVIVGENVLITQLAERLKDFIKRLTDKNNRIKEILKTNPELIFKKDVTVYIPINLYGSHWVTGCFSFQFNRDLEEEGAQGMVLTKAKLIDSLKRDESQKASLLTRFSSEVRKVSTDCAIEVEATGAQTDGIRCGDYTCREILTAFGENTLKDKKNENLRNAVIEHLKDSMSVLAAAIEKTEEDEDAFEISDLEDEEHPLWRFDPEVVDKPKVKRARFEYKQIDSYKKSDSLEDPIFTRPLPGLLNRANPPALGRAHLGGVGFRPLLCEEDDDVLMLEPTETNMIHTALPMEGEMLAEVNTEDVSDERACAESDEWFVDNGENNFDLAAPAFPEKQMQSDDTAAGENHKQLMQFINEGNEKKVQELIDKKEINLDQKTPNGLTALMRAVDSGRLDIVQALLAAGASLEIQDAKGATALVHAVDRGRLDVVQALLAAGASIDVQDAKGCTALMHADRNGLKVVQALLAAGASIEIQDAKGVTALMHAIDRSRLNIVQALLAAGASIDVQDAKGATALMHAVDRGRLDIIQALLAAGASIEIQDAKGFNALMHADRNELKVVQALLAAGANMNLQDSKKNTALMNALERGYLDVAEALLKAGADLDIKNKAGETPRSVILKKKYYSLHTFFHNSETIHRKKTAVIVAPVVTSDIAKTREGKTAEENHKEMMHAITYDEKKALELIKKRKVNLDQRYDHGMTALELAAAKGVLSIVEALLAAGATIDSQDHEGNTPLMIAAYYGHLNVVSFLLKKKANPILVNYQRKTMLTLAQERGHVHIVAYLKKLAESAVSHKTFFTSSTDLEKTDVGRKRPRDEMSLPIVRKDGAKETALTATKANTPGATKHDYLMESVYWLKYKQKERMDSVGGSSSKKTKGDDAVNRDLDKMAEWLEKAIPEQKYSSLLWAIERNYLREVQLLIKHGAEVNDRDALGRTFLMIAACCGYLDIVNTLLANGVDLNMGDLSCYTAIAYAAITGHVDIVKTLLTKGARIDIKYLDNWTVLMYAANAGHAEVVKVLLVAGADADLRNNLGETALALAKKHPDNKAVVEILEAHEKGRLTPFLEVLMEAEESFGPRLG